MMRSVVQLRPWASFSILKTFWTTQPWKCLVIVSSFSVIMLVVGIEWIILELCEEEHNLYYFAVVGWKRRATIHSHPHVKSKSRPTLPYQVADPSVGLLRRFLRWEDWKTYVGQGDTWYFNDTPKRRTCSFFHTPKPKILRTRDIRFQASRTHLPSSSHHVLSNRSESRIESRIFFQKKVRRCCERERIPTGIYIGWRITWTYCTLNFVASPQCSAQFFSHIYIYI